MGEKTQLAVFLAVFFFLSAVECKPRHHPQYSNSRAAFSAASYDSLGIQPGDRPGRSLGQNGNQYWWQGPQSPFREGAGQGVVQSGSTSHRQVIGCSGGGCGNSFNPHGVAASASVSSSSSSYGSAASSNNAGGNCCNYYWQKPGHPCATHQGNDCPRSFSCVHFRQCVNGHMSSIFSGYTSDRPSLTELMEYGKPCGNSGTEVCCSQSPPPTTAPVYAPVTSAPTQTYGSTYAPAPSFNPIAIHPTEAPPVQQPVYVSPPAPQIPPVEQSYLPPPVQQPVYVPPPPTSAPYVQCSYSQECVQDSVCAARFGQYSTQNTPKCQSNGFIGVCCNRPLSTTTTTPRPPPPPPTQPILAPPDTYLPPPIHKPMVTKPPPPPVYQPVVAPPPPIEPVYAPPPPVEPVYAPPPPIEPVYAQPPPIQPVVAPAGPPVNILPYPGCAAALKCVEERFCSKEGVMVDQPVNLTPHEKEFRVPLMPCLNTETNLVGYCCRDPFYEDPWPGGMMMPGMPAKPPVAPVVVQPTRPPPPPPTSAPYVQCSYNQECVQDSVCAARFGQYSTQNTPKCQSNGFVGVCCNRPLSTTTTTLRPPPPPPTQPVLAPDLSYLPPLPSPPKPLPAVQPVVVATTPALPPVDYLPPILPPVDFLPPPLPAVAAQIAEQPQCGASRAIPQQLANGEASLGEFPWHAMVAQKNGTMSCSGALIGAKFIATAYHCVRGVNPTNLVVRLGEQRVGSNEEILPHYEIPVMAVVGHPEFAEGSLFNDMAVLMLAQAAPSGLAHISPICLPTQSEQLIGQQCVATGWGHDTISGLQPGMLNKVQVQVVRNPDCQSSLQSTHLGKYFKLHQSFTCASTQNSINPCKLDGGSPMACKRPDGSYVLAGLSSWSVGCSNQQQPAVFADIPPVAPWLQQQMGQPEANLVDTSNSAFHQQQQFQSSFGAGAGYGR